MSSTYLSLNHHLIFSTKKREPCIAPEWRAKLHRYLGGIVSSLEGHAHCIGGTNDHVHLLVELKATHCLADFMRDLKRGSSSWVHSDIPCETFAWQEGYAAIAVSPSGMDEVRRYIDNQEEHHRHRSSLEEFADYFGEGRDKVQRTISRVSDALPLRGKKHFGAVTGGTARGLALPPATDPAKPPAWLKSERR